MNVFQCKQFAVRQQQSAMKVGTDAMVLGAWVGFDKAKNLLDIGTGTGILSLMAAQRFPELNIEAVEIDEKSYDEASLNFKNAVWHHRLKAYHTSIQEFAVSKANTFDAIVSNPPYFPVGNIQSFNSRNVARQTYLLNPVTLLQLTKKLLKNDGLVAYSLPFEMENFYLELAATLGLYPKRILRMYDTENVTTKRTFIELFYHQNPIIYENLVLKNSDKTYTDQFKALTKDFYTVF